MVVVSTRFSSKNTPPISERNGHAGNDCLPSLSLSDKVAVELGNGNVELSMEVYAAVPKEDDGIVVLSVVEFNDIEVPRLGISSATVEDAFKVLASACDVSTVRLTELNKPLDWLEYVKEVPYDDKRVAVVSPDWLLEESESLVEVSLSGIEVALTTPDGLLGSPEDRNEAGLEIMELVIVDENGRLEKDSVDKVLLVKAGVTLVVSDTLSFRCPALGNGPFVDEVRDFDMIVISNELMGSELEVEATVECADEFR
ncbi:MAG: hypothetical protein M1836_000798 [Candelina mexicana]|nr:MAG: hypothetical protein M1836_000798 [Candelina mexicana]